jgi:hypothetical protein
VRGRVSQERTCDIVTFLRPCPGEKQLRSYVAELVVWARWLLQCFWSVFLAPPGKLKCKPLWSRALREAAGSVRSVRQRAPCTADSTLDCLYSCRSPMTCMHVSPSQSAN